jgi:hypothetical protein
MNLNCVPGILVCLILLTTGQALAEPEAETYTVQVAVYKIESDMSEALFDTPPDTDGFFQVPSESSGGSVSERADALLRAEQEKVQEGKRDEPAIALLANPTIKTRAGQDAQLSIIKKIPLAYLEPAACGDVTHFVRKKMFAEVGIRLDVNVASTGKPDVADLRMEYHSLSVGERENIPGMGLDVGRPSVADDIVSATTRVRRGDWVALYRKVPGDGYILLMAQVQPDAEDAATEPESSPPAESSPDVSTQPPDEPEPIIYAVDTSIFRVNGEDGQSILDALEISPDEAPSHGNVNIFRGISACPDNAYDGVKQWFESQDSIDILAGPRMTIQYDPLLSEDLLMPEPGSGLDAHLTPAFRSFIAGARQRTGYILDYISQTPDIVFDPREKVITGGILMGFRLSASDKAETLDMDLAFEHRDLDAVRVAVESKARKSKKQIIVRQDAFRVTVPCTIDGWVGFTYQESGRETHIVILATVNPVPGTVEFVKPVE